MREQTRRVRELHPRWAHTGRPVHTSAAHVDGKRCELVVGLARADAQFEQRGGAGVLRVGGGGEAGVGGWPANC